jgi:hypothetical protein
MHSEHTVSLLTLAMTPQQERERSTPDKHSSKWEECLSLARLVHSLFQ